MTNSNQTRLPWIFVGLLVLLNVVVLTVLWLRPGPPPHPNHQDGKKGGLVADIGLEGEVAEKAYTLQKEHFQRMEQYFQEIIALRKAAVSQIGDPAIDSTVAMTALDKIGEVQVAAEKERFRHFSELFGLCNADQAQRFKETLPRAMERRGQPENGGPMGRSPGRPGGPEGQD